MMTTDDSSTKKIMVVDDDRALGEMLSIVLTNEGFHTVTCRDGIRATQVFPIVQPDLILLDVMLPGIDGITVASKIRESDNVPIIMLTAKSDTKDVVAGLEAGADDYIAKPFKVVELMARIQARFRVASPTVETSQDQCGDPLERGVMLIDRREHLATCRGVDLHLTPIEFALLFTLAQHGGEVLTRQTLLKEVWGYESYEDTRLVNVHMQRLRAKIEKDPENPVIVQTVRGIGYKFVAPEH